MIPLEEFTDAIRQTLEHIRQSNKLWVRAKGTLSESASIIDRTRQLLLENAVDGTPTLFHLNLDPLPTEEKEAGAASQPRAAVPGNRSIVERIVGQNFAEEKVRLDGRHFVDCNLDACTLEYSGGPVVLEGTHFSGCRFQFGGEAAMTVSVLECFGLIEDPRPQPSKSSRADSGSKLIN